MKRTAADAARTRERVLEAALFEFAERGYSAAKLGDIAARAGVTRGAAYHHFADKTELYVAVLSESWESVVGPLFDVLSGPGSAVERLRAFLVAYQNSMINDARFRALLMTGVARVDAGAAGGAEKTSAVYADWRARIAAVCAEAGVEDPDRTATMVLIWMNGITVTVAFTPDMMADAGTAESVAEKVLAGLF